MREWAKGLGYRHKLTSVTDEFIGPPKYKEVLNGTKYRFKSRFKDYLTYNMKMKRANPQKKSCPF